MVDYSAYSLIEKFYRHKKVLITGHTGFKGAWMTAWLKKIGAEVIGISLEESNDLSHFNVASIGKGMKDYRLDIRDQK